MSELLGWGNIMDKLIIWETLLLLFIFFCFCIYNVFPIRCFFSFLKSSQCVWRLIFHVSDPWSVKFFLSLGKGSMLWCVIPASCLHVRSWSVDWSQYQFYHPLPFSSLFGSPQPISSYFYQRDFNFLVSIYLKAIIDDVHNDSKHCDAITMFRINFRIL